MWTRKLFFFVVGISEALRGGSDAARRGGGAALRRRVLPIYVPPVDRPSVPAPIPGDVSRKLRYTFKDSASQLAFVQDVARYGAFVHVPRPEEGAFNGVREGTIGCVVDATMASVAEGDGAVVGVCASIDNRCVVEQIVKEFPYAAARVSPLFDTSTFSEDDVEDPLSAYDFVEDDEECLTTVEKARERCTTVLDEALRLADGLEPHFGNAEFAAMRTRAANLVAETDDDDEERYDRTVSFSLLSISGAPPSLIELCLLTKSAARRYAAIARHLEPIRAELSAVTSLKPQSYQPPPPRPAPMNPSLSIALLRPGRRLSYWWSDQDQWSQATIHGLDPEQPNNYLVAFDTTPRDDDALSDEFVSLPLASPQERWRWKLLPL